MAGGVTVGFGRSRALVGEQTVSWSGEACALHSYHSSEPFAASRVCDERSGTNRRTALDPAPASQALPVSLDFADAFIDILSLEGRSALRELCVKPFPRFMPSESRARWLESPGRIAPSRPPIAFYPPPSSGSSARADSPRSRPTPLSPNP